MQAVQGLLLGVCFAGVLGGIVYLLSPGGSTDRVLRLVITLFVLTAAATPLRTVVRLTMSEPTQIPKDAAVDAVLQNAETAIRQTARHVMERYGCTDAEIDVEVGTNDGEVHAKTFVIRGVPSDKTREIVDEIFRLTGEVPRVETRD